MFFVQISETTWVNVEDISAVIAQTSGVPVVHLSNGMSLQARMFPRDVDDQKTDDVVEDFFAYVGEEMDRATKGITA
jgi:hypothetical protein